MEYNEQVADAGRLLSFGLQPRLLPGKDPAYDELLARYCSDSRFRRVVDDLAQGLGIEVIYASNTEGPGFYLRALSGSPFVYTLAQFRTERGMSESASTVRARGFAGLILVGIAAYFYPRAESLAHAKHPIASAKKIDTFIRGLCEELRAREEAQEAQGGEAGPEPAWKVYLREKEISQGSDGRRGQQGTIPMVEKMLEYLCLQGLMTRVHEKGEGTAGPQHYQPLEKFRQHILRSATVEVSDLFDLASDVRIEQRRAEIGGS